MVSILCEPIDMHEHVIFSYAYFSYEVRSDSRQETREQRQTTDQTIDQTTDQTADQTRDQTTDQTIDQTTIWSGQGSTGLAWAGLG